MRRIGVFLLVLGAPAWMPWMWPATVGDPVPAAQATSVSRPRTAIASAFPVTSPPPPTPRPPPTVVAPTVMAATPPPVRPYAAHPALAADFPDPDIIRVGGQWWAYATGAGLENLQVRSSPDLATWRAAQDALPRLPAWATPGYTWAPAVVASAGGFLMYYSVRETAAGRQCLSVAASSAPSGPFTDASSGPLACQTGVGGSIDPEPFTAPDGTRYLLWKSEDNALGHASRIGVQQLTADGLGLVGARPRLLSATARWQGGVVEGPSMVADRGRFYLFYGAGHWDTSGAGIGYAVCDTPLGPCSNQSRAGPWLRSTPAAPGPSGPDVFTGPDGRLWLAYHAWGGHAVPAPSGRQLWILPLTVIGGIPVIG